MRMKLHGYYRSSTSYRLRIALELKGIAYDSVPVNLRDGEQKERAFTSRNPFGSVPMLEAGGRDRAQSMALIEWLDEAYPDHPLLPADIEDRYTARELTYAIATELHAPLNLQVLKYLAKPLGHSQSVIDHWYRHWLQRTLGPVEARLKQLGTEGFLFGGPGTGGPGTGGPGIFETVLIPQIYNARRFHYDLTLHPRITRIEAACLALPAFQRAHPDQQPDAV
jgi:maleylacetoacetate isomerase/maleylpyruvate isomerase